MSEEQDKQCQGCDSSGCSGCSSVASVGSTPGYLGPDMLVFSSLVVARYNFMYMFKGQDGKAHLMLNHDLSSSVCTGDEWDVAVKKIK